MADGENIGGDIVAQLKALGQRIERRLHRNDRLIAALTAGQVAVEEDCEAVLGLLQTHFSDQMTRDGTPKPPA